PPVHKHTQHQHNTHSPLALSFALFSKLIALTAPSVSVTFLHRVSLNTTLVTRHRTREPFYQDGQHNHIHDHRVPVRSQLHQICLVVPLDADHCMARHPLASCRHIEANFAQTP